MAKETYLQGKRTLSTWQKETYLSTYLWQNRSQLLVHLGHLHVLGLAKGKSFDTQGIGCSFLVLAMLYYCTNYLPPPTWNNDQTARP
jgi:hypothetical protein